MVILDILGSRNLLLFFLAFLGPTTSFTMSIRLATEELVITYVIGEFTHSQEPARCEFGLRPFLHRLVYSKN